MVSSTPSVNRPVTGWVRYSGDRDWQEARFATATPVSAARFYVQNLTSGKASSIDLHRVTKMDELEWGKPGVTDMETVEVHIGGKASFEAMWPEAFTAQLLDCLWATVDEEANAQAPDVVDLRGEVAQHEGAPAPAWTPPPGTSEGHAPWADGAPASGPFGTPQPATPAPAVAPAPPQGPPVASLPPPSMTAPAPPPTDGGPFAAAPADGIESEGRPASKKRGWRSRREQRMSPVVGILAIAGCALLAIGGFIMWRGDDPATDPSEVLSETTINEATTVAPATTLVPGETTTTSTTVVAGG